MLLKQFILKPDSKKSFDLGGGTVNPGGKVWLTQSQAKAFRDRFDPVDGSDFVEKDDFPPVENLPGAESQVPPVTHVLEDTKVVPPADPSTLDPNRQGQRDNDQRDHVDAGGSLDSPKGAEGAAEQSETAAKSQAAGQARSTGMPGAPEYKDTGKESKAEAPKGVPAAAKK